VEGFRGKRITVVGLGRSGRAAANLLAEAGALVRVSEAQPEERIKGELCSLLDKGVEFEFGGHRPESLMKSDLVVLSPGVPSNLPGLVAAQSQGVRIMGEVELAFLFTSATFVGVTGSNGKSTTVTLLGEMLKAGGRPSLVAGNIGTALCDVVRDLAPQYIVVTELSSFQLETIETFRCHISVLLNLSPDHLDRYPNMMAYAQAKARIFENQRETDFAIVNADDDLSMSLSSGIKSQLLLFSRKRPVEEGCFLAEGKVLFRMGGHTEEICPAGEIAIKGVHNLENAMAAVAAGSLLGLEPMVLRKALQSFPGLEHRLELVLEKDGVRYVNDSKGTNVGAVLKSLESFESPIILIAGGRDKGSDFSPLMEAAKGRVKSFILIGEAKEKIRAAVSASASVFEACDMKDAVRRAHSLAEKGDVVLLSPACASFDMFANFEERGRVFRNEVLGLFAQGDRRP
jgi:UDP-N-acetylmuramoylalanine--D-glutamate ligase